ncbi:MAG: hypothetical protein ABUS47_11860 [Steroidobacter sp.]
MHHNPYSPPVSDVENVTDVPSRPVSVWLFLAIMLLSTTSLTIGLARSLWLVATHVFHITNYTIFAMAIGLRVLVIVLSVTVMIGVVRAKNWGRWIGIALLCAFALWSFFRTDTTHYASAAESAGGFVGQFVLVPLLLGWWIYSFGFSAKARGYFSVADSVF